MQSSEDLRAFGILLVITVDRFGFCRYLTLMLCFEDSFAADWSIIVDYAILQFRYSSHLHGYILFLYEWREESKKWRNLNSLYQHQQQLTNYSCTTDTIFKIWQLVDSFLVIIISDMRRSFIVFFYVKEHQEELKIKRSCSCTLNKSSYVRILYMGTYNSISFSAIVTFRIRVLLWDSIQNMRYLSGWLSWN